MATIIVKLTLTQGATASVKKIGNTAKNSVTGLGAVKSRTKRRRLSKRYLRSERDKPRPKTISSHPEDL